MEDLKQIIEIILEEYRLSDWQNILRDDIVEAVEEWMNKRT